MNTKNKVSESAKKLQEAEQAFLHAKAVHEKEFLAACVELFNEYGLALVTEGSEGSRLEVREITGTFRIDDLDL